MTKNAIMDRFHTFDDYGDIVGVNEEKDTVVQIVLSVAVGLGAFLAFCVRYTGAHASK